MRAESWTARRRRMNDELAAQIEVAYHEMRLAIFAGAGNQIVGLMVVRAFVERYVALRFVQARRDAIGA